MTPSSTLNAVYLLYTGFVRESCDPQYAPKDVIETITWFGGNFKWLSDPQLADSLFSEVDIAKSVADKFLKSIVEFRSGHLMKVMVKESVRGEVTTKRSIAFLVANILVLVPESTIHFMVRKQCLVVFKGYTKWLGVGADDACNNAVDIILSHSSPNHGGKHQNNKKVLDFMEKELSNSRMKQRIKQKLRGKYESNKSMAAAMMSSIADRDCGDDLDLPLLMQLIQTKYVRFQ